MNFDWYPWYIQPYRKNTMHLGLAEDGAYRRLIDEYMMTRAPLPDNDAALARIIGVSKDEWLTVAPVVRAFFEVSNGKLVHGRCQVELMQQASLADTYSIRAKTAADARWKSHRENKRAVNGLMRQASLGHASVMPNDATRQRKKEEEVNGSLATALPSGALREPSGGKLQVSNALKTIVASKGWNR